jgi:hypothetical protein
VEVEYELNFNDIKAGLAENITNNLKAKRRYTLARIVYIFFGILLIGVSLALGTDNLGFMLFTGIFGVFFLIYGLLYRAWIRWILLRVSLNKNKSNEVTVKHKVSLARESITINAENKQTKVRWTGVEKISSNKNYLFLTAASSKLYVVPRRAFTDDEAFNKFVDAAKGYKERAR